MLLFIFPVGFASANPCPFSLNQRINIIFGDKDVYRKDLGNTVNLFYKSATLTILEAKTCPELLSQENRFILWRPTDSGDPDYYGAATTVITYDTPEGKFKIHYTEDDTNGDAAAGSDGDISTIPQFVINAGAAFENSYSHDISLGYPPLPDDGEKGGDNRFDVYILNLPGAYGYATYDDVPAEAYIVIDNDFATVPDNLDPEGRQRGAIKATAAHELFHAFQFQYSTDIADNGWWMEATAVWMEDEVYPEVNDYLNYIGLRYDDADDNGKWDIGETYYRIDGSVAGTAGRSRKWFDKPEISLDTYDGSFEYGTVIWAKYLSETFGRDTIRSIWTIIGTGATALDAISEELDLKETTLTDAYTSFQLANYKRNYIDGVYYPIIRHEDAYTSYPQTVSSSLDHLASNYYALKSDSTTSILSLTFTDMDSGSLVVRLVLNRVEGGWDEQDVTLDSPSVTKKITNFGTSSTYSKVVAIVMNTSSSKNGERYSISACKEVSSGSSGGGGGCFIATAAYGSLFEGHVEILRQFRDVYLLTNRIGQSFVQLYYKYSPPLAGFIASNESRKTIVRYALYPLVGVSYVALHTTFAQQALIMFGLVAALRFRSVVMKRRLKKINAINMKEDF